MAIKLRIECVSGAYFKKECVRVVAMDEEATLCDLHETIQDAVSFDRDHLYDFFIANSASPFAKRESVSEKDEWEDREDDFGEILVRDILPSGRKTRYYLFDFGDDWTFEIRKVKPLKGEKEPDSLPCVLERKGPNPEQYPDADED